MMRVDYRVNYKYIMNQKAKDAQTEDFPSTTRKGRITGITKYIHQDTGVVEDFNVLSIEDCDANFQKIWLAHILIAIDEIGNAKMQILNYLLKNRYLGNNTLIKTGREIAAETGVSYQTVVRTLQALEKHHIIKRKPGIIILNPDVMFKGSHKHRMNILIQYHHFAEGTELFDETDSKVIDGKFPKYKQKLSDGEIA